MENYARVKLGPSTFKTSQGFLKNHIKPQIGNIPLAEKIGVNKVWLASAFEGQQYVPEEYCDKLAEALGIDKSATAFLAEHPYKGNTDPILYRLHEVIDTYGPAIKDIIHEQGGNAIMSAIDFGLDVDVTEDAEGNHRVIIKFDGKLLPYAKKGQYPW